MLPLVLCSGIIGGILIGRFIEQRRVSPSQEKVQRILDLIESQYVDEIDVDSLLENSIPDLLLSLDPHSAYIPES